MNKSEKFNLHEVGLTHIDNDAFIKIDDSGRIILMAQPNLGIIMDPSNQSISIMADSVKFITKQDEGLRWNNLSFNPKAFNYAEPTFLYSKDVVNRLYDDVDQYLQ